MGTLGRLEDLLTPLELESLHKWVRLDSIAPPNPGYAGAAYDRYVDAVEAYDLLSVSTRMVYHDIQRLFTDELRKVEGEFFYRAQSTALEDFACAVFHEDSPVFDILEYISAHDVEAACMLVNAERKSAKPTGRRTHG